MVLVLSALSDNALYLSHMVAELRTLQVRNSATLWDKSVHRLIMLNICNKFQENISKGFRVIERVIMQFVY